MELHRGRWWEDGCIEDEPYDEFAIIEHVWRVDRKRGAKEVNLT